MLKAYAAHVQERAAQQLPPLPLSAEQVALLVELLKSPPAGEETLLVDLLENRTPAGVDQAAYVKAAFLSDVASGKAKSPLISAEKAVQLLGTMLGGYNVQALVALLDTPMAEAAVKALSQTILMFDAFHDVDEKMKAGNLHAKKLIESWAKAEWFTNAPKLAEEIKMVVFKVDGETNTDDLSPAQDAWSRPGYSIARKSDAYQ
jgi:aconitate hydratase 2 / 2-methylisocitrate dehydratase